MKMVRLGHIANLARQAIEKGHEVVGSDGDEARHENCRPRQGTS